MPIPQSDSGEPAYTSSITGVAMSNQSLVIISTVGFGFLGLAMYFVLRQLSATAEENEIEERDYDEILEQSDVAMLNRAQRRARAKYRMKNTRRAAVPGQQQLVANEGDGPEVGGGEGEIDGGEGNNGDVSANANLSRKERRLAAKQQEREERKAYAEEARLYREKKNRMSDDKRNTSEENNKKLIAKELSIEDIFPQRANKDDALSEYLFWETIMKKMKQEMETNDNDDDDDIRIPKMVTIHDFVERLKQTGSVSVASLAEEFGITVPEALEELESMNQQHGIIGVLDSKGNFVYVSLDMIKEAIKIGQEAGRVECPISIGT